MEQSEGQAYLMCSSKADKHIVAYGSQEPLKVVCSVSNAVNADNCSVSDKYPQCFKGVGKLKSFQLEIQIDPGVKLLIQPMRRIPYSLRDKLANKLDELLDLPPVP
uniref:Uncharacterized protein n=1 Tax=Magallana gigas TaxID=29159 RepID=A0A8W8LL19_MAGGI